MDDCADEEVIEWLIDTLSTASFKKDKLTLQRDPRMQQVRKPFPELPLSYFAEAEPLIEETNALRNRALPTYTRFAFADVTPKDLDTWDVSIIAHEISPDVVFDLSRVRKVPLSELRGKKLFTPDVTEVAYALVRKDGSYSSRMATVYLVNGKWMKVRGPVTNLRGYHQDVTDYDQSVVLRGGRQLTYDTVIHDRIQLSLGIQFSRYYDWRVVLGYEGGVSISFATDPLGAKEVFRLRDIPEGASRRAALRNWVREHYRQRRDTGDETKVRKHLRGATDFNWSGLNCVIYPSKYDLKRAEELRLQREAEKAKEKLCTTMPIKK